MFDGICVWNEPEHIHVFGGPDYTIYLPRFPDARLLCVYMQPPARANQATCRLLLTRNASRSRVSLHSKQKRQNCSF